jgi:hypothetical protein
MPWQNWILPLALVESALEFSIFQFEFLKRKRKMVWCDFSPEFLVQSHFSSSLGPPDEDFLR